MRPAERLGLGLRKGQKVPLESFWNVPLGPMQQIWPQLDAGTYHTLIHDLFYKAQRANQDDLAVTTVGLALGKLLTAGVQVERPAPSSDARVANRNGTDLGWEIAHAAVSRRPPISLTCTRTPRKVGICSSFKDPFLSPRVKP